MTGKRVLNRLLAQLSGHVQFNRTAEVALTGVGERQSINSALRDAWQLQRAPSSIR